jgi:hypothetical protein
MTCPVERDLADHLQQMDEADARDAAIEELAAGIYESLLCDPHVIGEMVTDIPDEAYNAFFSRVLVDPVAAATGLTAVLEPLLWARATDEATEQVEGEREW